MNDLSHLYEFCTVRQLETIQAIEQAGSNRKAAKALGIMPSAVDRSLIAVKKKAANQLIAEHADPQRVPDGFLINGTTTLRKDGKEVMQWVKTSADKQRQWELMQEAVAALREDIPKVGAIKPPKGTVEHLCNVYTLTDSHVGMLAWHKEAGADWDLSIAEQTLIGCFEQMLTSSPEAKTCVIAQLGDFLHSDGLVPVTPTSGHVLDQDGRFAKVVRTAIRVLRHVIRAALRKHERVVVLMAEGNHDMASSVWLRAMFQAMYENEPRIHVIDSELPYYVHQHGETMLAWHHGHLKKNDQLPLLFAAQFPRVWGATEKRYCHVGHWHHSEEKEHSGMVVVQHPTLAARDAYAARGGWIAERRVTAITYHLKHGEVARTTVTPEMLA